jgi:hypothetical protein
MKLDSKRIGHSHPSEMGSAGRKGEDKLMWLWWQ